MNDPDTIQDQLGEPAPRIVPVGLPGSTYGMRGPLDGEDLIRRALGSVDTLYIPDDAGDRQAATAPTINFSFKAAVTGALEFTVQPGDIEIAPDTVIPWASIAGASIINTVTPSVNRVWYGWCDVNVDAGTATIAYGDAWPAALTTEQKVNTVRRRLVHLVLVSDGGTPPVYSISAIKNIQCGNVDVDALDEVVEESYPFKVTVTQTGESTYSASIQTGRWTRNPELGNSALSLEVPCVRAITDGNFFLCVVIGRHTDALTKDPRLYPNAISVVAVNSPEKDTIIGFTDLFTTGGWKYGGHVVLGTVVEGFGWEQYWKGGDITDALEVNDGDSASTTSPRVRTLERHPQDFPYPTGAHAYENQIMNADAATVDNYNVPYLPKDSGGSGDLTWARLDTHKVSTTSKSIEVASGDLQVKGWAAATGTTRATGDLILAQRVVSGARDAVYLSADSPIDNYPWKVTVTQTGPTTYSANTQQGRWTRNTDVRNTSLTLASPSVAPITNGHYFIALIYRATNPFTKDARLYPTDIGVTSIAATDKASVLALGVFAGGELATYNYGGHVVLGKLTAGVWEQYWKGGDITDYLEVPDSDTVNHIPSGERHTIERNPLTTAREGELQLFNADEAVMPKNVALLSVRNVEETPAVMEMEYPAVDSYAGGAALKTIDVATKSTKILCLKNADLVSAGGKHMGYLDVTSGAELKWANLDTHKSGAAKSLEIFDATAQIHGFGSATPALTSFGTGDKVLVRHSSEVHYADYELLRGLQGETGPQGPQGTPGGWQWDTHDGDYSSHHTHHGLGDIAPSASAVDDHCGDRAAGAGGTGMVYLHASGLATRNAMSGVIGDGSSVQSIAPTARTLDGESDAGNVGWKVTSTADVNFGTGAAKGALVVAGGITAASTIKAVFLDARTAIYCSGTADATDGTPSIEAGGGIRAAKKVQAGTIFMVGAAPGISKNVSWEDVNGQVHTLEITGGIITDYTVA